MAPDAPLIPTIRGSVALFDSFIGYSELRGLQLACDITRGPPCKSRRIPVLSRWMHAILARDTCWLGRQDSNLGMAESKSAALPLGYAPKPAQEGPRRT